MNLMYCGDANVRTGLILSVLSILEHTDRELHIYVLTMSWAGEEKTFAPLPAQSVELLEPVLKEKNRNSTIEIIDITNLFQKEVPEHNLGTRFTPYCMLRLFADVLPRIPDKILYLDTDVLCRGDLAAFYDQGMDDWEFAGVLDYYGSWFFRRKWYRRDYCNSGVLLLNMKRIRQTGLFTHCRKLCETKKMFVPAQSALNKLVSAKKICPRKFIEQRKLHDDTVLQHFATGFRFFPVFRVVSVKPWMFSQVQTVLKLHEYDALFEQYAQLIKKENNENENQRTDPDFSVLG